MSNWECVPCAAYATHCTPYPTYLTHADTEMSSATSGIRIRYVNISVYLNIWANFEVASSRYPGVRHPVNRIHHNAHLTSLDLILIDLILILVKWNKRETGTDFPSWNVQKDGFQGGTPDFTNMIEVEELKKSFVGYKSERFSQPQRSEHRRRYGSSGPKCKQLLCCAEQLVWFAISHSRDPHARTNLFTTHKSHHTEGP